MDRGKGRAGALPASLPRGFVIGEGPGDADTGDPDQGRSVHVPRHLGGFHDHEQLGKTQDCGEARHWHRGGGLDVLGVLAARIVADGIRSLASPVVAAAVFGEAVGGEGRGGTAGTGAAAVGEVT